MLYGNRFVAGFTFDFANLDVLYGRWHKLKLKGSEIEEEGPSSDGYRWISHYKAIAKSTARVFDL
jgi:hypothetical protein